MKKNFLFLSLALTLAAALLLGCVSPTRAAAASASATGLADTDCRSEAVPAVTCPVYGSDDCTRDNCVGADTGCRAQKEICTVCNSDTCDGVNCGRNRYCDDRNTVCREQKKACTNCGSDACDGGQLCTRRDECPRYSVNGHHQSGRHQSGHHGK